MKVMAVGAHPDDLEATFMGTLIKYKQQGHELSCVIASNGQAGKPEGPGLTKIRQAEARASLAHLGIEPIFLNFEDGQIIYDQETYKACRQLYAQLQPDVIFTHDPGDYHPDHRVISRLITDVSWVPVFYADNLGGIAFEPQFYIDISAQFDLKMTMLKEHKTQCDHTPILSQVPIQHQFRAMQCGKDHIKYAESYRLFHRLYVVQGYELLPR